MNGQRSGITPNNSFKKVSGARLGDGWDETWRAANECPLLQYVPLPRFHGVTERIATAAHGELICYTRHFVSYRIHPGGSAQCYRMQGRLLSTVSSEIRRPILLTQAGQLAIYMRDDSGVYGSRVYARGTVFCVGLLASTVALRLQ